MSGAKRAEKANTRKARVSKMSAALPLEKPSMQTYNNCMTLRAIFRYAYGKEWKDASFWEKTEAILLGMVLLH